MRNYEVSVGYYVTEKHLVKAESAHEACQQIGVRAPDSSEQSEKEIVDIKVLPPRYVVEDDNTGYDDYEVKDTRTGERVALCTTRKFAEAFAKVANAEDDA